MDFRPTDQHELLRRTIREFAEAEIRPHVMEWDETQHFPSELIPRLAALGLMGIQIPEAYGGAPLLGFNGAVMKAHGSAREKAIANAYLVRTDTFSGTRTSHVPMEPHAGEEDIAYADDGRHLHAMSLVFGPNVLQPRQLRSTEPSGTPHKGNPDYLPVMVGQGKRSSVDNVRL